MDNATTLKFNTGRGYTDKGQRIAAALLDNGDIYFVDIDRMIDGLITGGAFTQRGIMAGYDSGSYSYGGYEIRSQYHDALTDLARSI